MGIHKGYTPPPPPSNEDILNSIKSTLQAYVDGQEFGSETILYDDYVKQIREFDSEKAKILEEGFAELKKMRSGSPKVKSKAKEMLEKL